MRTLKYNIPCFSPPIGYQHKINPNAAWVRSKPSLPHVTISTGRNLLPPSPSNPEPKTPWGSPMPIWRPGQHVLVQLYSPNGAWHQAIVLDVLCPAEVASLSAEELEAVPPSRLAKLVCRYAVQLIEEGGVARIWTDIDENFLAPTHLEEQLKANAVKFMMGERVLVQMSQGSKRRTHIGHISGVFGDQVLRDKSSWHVVPRLYKVYINDLETSGFWTAESIVEFESPKPEESVPLLVTHDLTDSAQTPEV